VSENEKDKRGFALQPDQPVASFALISSIMPHDAGRHPQTYRLAFVITIGAALLASLFGALPIAVMIAAFAIPVVYLVYLYDVNLWEDSPVIVTVLACVVTAVLAGGFTWLWTGWMPFSTSLRNPTNGSLLGGPNLIAFLLFAICVPIVGEAIRQIGPVILASRPAFDDLMDGVTFGIASGVAYASLDTIVRNWALLTGGMVAPAPGQWASLILLEGFVKPLVMGTATGLAAAEFSGLGKGYDGFTPRYYVGVAIAIGANIVYAAGVYLLGFVGPTPEVSVVLQLLWGLIVLGVLILRLRNVLHTGLMESALEAAARSTDMGGEGKATDLDFCPRCEMPLIEGAAFCSACGSSTRARPKVLSQVGAAATPQPPGPPIETPPDEPAEALVSPDPSDAGQPTVPDAAAESQEDEK